MQRPVRSAVTIVDLARHLQLSPSAVSQALRLKPDSTTKVSKETVKAVRDLALKWNYRPNSSARRMKGQALQQAGFVLEYRFENRRVPWINMPAILGVSDCLVKRKWHLNIIQDEREQQLPIHLPDYLLDNSLEGVVVASCESTRDEAILNDLRKCQIPSILLNGTSSTNTVILNDKYGMALGMKHLLDLGHKRIVFITDKSATHASASLREQSYIECMTQAGLTPHIWSYSIPSAGPTDTEQMRQRVDELRKKEFYYDLYEPYKPTALACVSDLDALRLSQILLENEVRIPEEISIVGYDDFPYLYLHYPPITTVRSSFYDMGYKAAEMLLQLIETKVESIPSVVLQPELVVRKSTAPPKH